MNATFSFEYTAPWLILCVLIGALYAFLLYWRDTKSGYLNGAKRYGLAAARFIVVTIIAVLLMNPYLRNKETEVIKPIVVLLQDASSSAGVNEIENTQLKEGIIEMQKQLSERFDVYPYHFSDVAESGFDFEFTGKATNISGALDDIKDRFFNRPIKAVVLASDGIYNQGILPSYSIDDAPFKLYTVALGDTTTKRDLRFGNIFCNKIAYVNDRLSAQIEVEAGNAQGTEAVLSIFEVKNDGNKLLETKKINIANNNFFFETSTVLSVEKPGVARFRFELSRISDEITYKNNIKDLFIEVLDGRQKILLLALSPHPDLGAIKSGIEENKNFQTEIQFADNFRGNWNDYSLAIFHQLPSDLNPSVNLIEQAKQKKIPMLFIAGSQSSAKLLSQAQNVVTVNSGGNRLNDAAVATNKTFAAFTLSENLSKTLPKLPPLITLFGEFAANPATRILAYQKINNIETDFPLIAFTETGEQKTGFIAGEGLWRWRMYDFQINKSHDATNELVQKTVQYLATKADKRPFKIIPSKNVFAENESILFEAQFYNDNYEAINTPDALLEIRNSDGKSYPYQFSRTENAYNLNAGILPEGNYTYSGSLKSGNREFKASGNFTVTPLQLEEMRTTADHRLLYRLSDKLDGLMAYPSNMNTITQKILEDETMKPVLFDTYKTESAIHLKWIFFLLLLLLSAEWFVRKFSGGY